MKILVTGSAGNIGREQVRQLQEAGHDIRGFDRVAKSRAMDYEYIAGDLRDLYTVRQAVGGVERSYTLVRYLAIGTVVQTTFSLPTCRAHGTFYLPV